MSPAQLLHTSQQHERALVPVGVVPELQMYGWWRLASGAIVELRRFQTEEGQAQVVVRTINEDGEMSPGEFVLTLRFLRMHGKPVMRAAR